MQVCTTRGNDYYYQVRTNIITAVPDDEKGFVWKYKPFRYFSEMPNVSIFVLSITEQCNLRCSYCFYSGDYEGNRVHGTRLMTKDDIDEIYGFIQDVRTKKPIQIAFYGGEPLTHFDLIIYAIEKGEDMWGQEVSFSLNTNGVLLSPKKTDWLVQHKVEMDISLDGTAAFHDAYRKDVKGDGTFSHVYSALLYLNDMHPDFMSFVHVLTTIPTFDGLEAMAQSWNEDELLRRISPVKVGGLAPNFSKGLKVAEWEQTKNRNMHLLDVAERHPEWTVLKAYFENCIAEWKARPIMDADESSVMPTCMPMNTKLFIDAAGNIGVCEKMRDCFRIGNVRTGIDWGRANELARTYYEKRSHRCDHCPAVRMCNMCLTALAFDNNQWDVLCQNERLYMKLDMLLFCEMAERGMLE